MQQSSEISYFGVAVNAGARDERNEEQGMAHFIEHMLFKGTKRRMGHHILGRMENVGGELNAYTTKEETFVYTTFLSEHMHRAVDLLSDIVIHSAFPPMQIEREKDVVLDEINSYLDTPTDMIYDDFENLLFHNHALGHYILGTPETVSNFNSDNLKNFFEKMYQPQNMVVFYLGKLPFEKVVKQIEKAFVFETQTVFAAERTKPQLNVPSLIKERKDTSQAHIMLGVQTHDMFHEKRHAMYLLNHLFGGGAYKSRLNNSLREKHGLVYLVESLLTMYTDAGLLGIYFGTDRKNVERCIRLIEKETAKLQEVKLTAQQMNLLKKQYKGLLGIAAENNENLALRMAKSYLNFNSFHSLHDTFAKIDAVTADEIQLLAQEFLVFENMTQLRYI